MKCPFRKLVKVEFADLGNGVIAVDTQTEEFMDCYQNECACYKWILEERRYVCKQVEEIGNIGGGIDPDEDEE